MDEIKYNKINNKINSHNFYENYSNINRILLVLSYFGHIVSIFLAHFFLFSIINNTIISNQIISYAASIIIISGIELLKRDLFDKFSIGVLRNNGLTKELYILLFFCSTLIFLSFYSSLNGAKMFSDKNVIIEKTNKKILETFKDSVKLVYNSKISILENEIKDIKNLINIKDAEQTEIESNDNLTRKQRDRIKDLKNEKTQLRNDISVIENKIAELKNEMNEIIKNKENEILIQTDADKKTNNKNSNIFIAISAFIEIIIIIGVFFNEYYYYRSYSEFTNKLKNDQNYQKWYIFDKILKCIYNDETKINDRLPSNKEILKLCKIKNINVFEKDVEDFIKIMHNLKIIKSSGRYRYYMKSKDDSLKILKQYYNINRY